MLDSDQRGTAEAVKTGKLARLSRIGQIYRERAVKSRRGAARMASYRCRWQAGLKRGKTRTSWHRKGADERKF